MATSESGPTGAPMVAPGTGGSDRRDVVTVIGVAAGPALLTAPATRALAAATLVVGGRRHLGAVEVPPGARTVELGDVTAGLAAVVDHVRADHGSAVVLASGDPGFFGIVAALRRRRLDLRVHPAVSSVALAFARLGLPWDDAVVVSAHGRDLGPVVNVCRAHPKVAVLTGPATGPARIGSALADTDRMLAVATALGTADERVECLRPDQAGGRTWPDPNVVLSLEPALLRPVADGAGTVGAAGLAWIAGAGRAPDGWALPENAFEYRDSMVTKAEVRSLVLARLGPGPGRLIWDVGAGSGSVAVECARFGAAVVAVDRDGDAVARVAGNARTHGVTVAAVQGTAPAALIDLPDPDGVFVGGGGADVLAGCLERSPSVIVVALAALDRVRPAWDRLAASGYEVGGTQVAASRLAALPDGGLRLAAANPVVLVWGRRPDRPSEPGTGRGTR